jgi:predicted AAA+ superfamily ATPase
MGGFALQETGFDAHSRHWLRGGFPLSFLAEDNEASFRWRQEFVQTFLERDVPQLGFAVPAMTMYRFWSEVKFCDSLSQNLAETQNGYKLRPNSLSSRASNF